MITNEIFLTLAVLVLALSLFLWNKLRVDVVGLILLGTVALTGLVSPREAVSGFSNEAVVTVAAMFVLSSGLLRTGVIDLLGRWVARLAGKSEIRLLLLSLVIVIPLSAFVNNTPVVVVMVPMILGLARKMNAAPSRLFMPISFGSQLGGTLTLIGTSTNLLVAGLVLELGLPRIHLFDVTRPGLIMAAVGVVYLLTVGRWLLPTREATTDLVETYELRDYLTVLRVLSDSPYVGRSLRESRFGANIGLQIVGIDRGGQRIAAPRGGTIIEEGDILFAEGKVSDIARIAESEHLEVVGAKEDVEVFPSPDKDESKEESRLAELIVTPRSEVIGRTLRQLNFRGRYGLPVLGIQRHGVSLHDRLGDVPLHSGDILLVEGYPEDLQRLHATGDLALLGALELPARRTRKMKFAVVIMVTVMLLAAFNVLPIMLAAILGVVGMFITGCVKPDEAYEDVDWMVLVLLGSIIPLGIAMQQSGTANLIGQQFLLMSGWMGPYGALAAFYLLTSLLTEIISNNAAAVVLTPVAIASAVAMGVSPLPFVIAVMFAASNSFMTPIGYQTNTFIFGPGGYQFSDFMRVGAPLNALMVVTATFVIPLFFPF
jgi:di/tricarboxylate transporter